MESLTRRAVQRPELWAILQDHINRIDLLWFPSPYTRGWYGVLSVRICSHWYYNQLSNRICIMLQSVPISLHVWRLLIAITPRFNYEEGKWQWSPSAYYRVLIGLCQVISISVACPLVCYIQTTFLQHWLLGIQISPAFYGRNLKKKCTHFLELILMGFSK